MAKGISAQTQQRQATDLVCVAGQRKGLIGSHPLDGGELPLVLVRNLSTDSQPGKHERNTWQIAPHWPSWARSQPGLRTERAGVPLLWIA